MYASDLLTPWGRVLIVPFALHNYMWVLNLICLPQTSRIGRSYDCHFPLTRAEDEEGRAYASDQMTSWESRSDLPTSSYICVDL